MARGRAVGVVHSSVPLASAFALLLAWGCRSEPVASSSSETAEAARSSGEAAVLVDWALGLFPEVLQAPLDTQTPSPSLPSLSEPAPSEASRAFDHRDYGLDLSGLLAPTDLRGMFAAGAELEELELQGIAPSSSYGSVRYRAQGAKNYGLALQWWQSGAASQERFEMHLKTYNGARPSEVVGARALWAKAQDILHLSWVSTDSQNVLTLTCDEALCSEASLSALAQLVEQRLAQMAKARPERAGTPTTPSSHPQLGGTGQAPNRQELGGTGQAPNRQELGGTGQAPNRQTVGEEFP